MVGISYEELATYYPLFGASGSADEVSRIYFFFTVYIYTSCITTAK